jgi:hypothetical protein
VRTRTLSFAVALFASSLAAFAAAEAPLVAGAAATSAGSAKVAPAPTVLATLAECVTSVTQSERSATFAGEMSAVPGTARMAMRIDVEQRLPHELVFRAVVAPGVGAWRTSEPKVKVFKYLKQVTDLAAPARYRASIHFRWFNAHGVTIRRAARLTRACAQPATPRTPPPTPEAPAA